MRKPLPFSYWYFYTLFRDEQNHHHKIIQMRRFIKNKSVLISIIAFLSIFNNFLLYVLLIGLGGIGLIELLLVVVAFFKGNGRYFKRKIKRESIWK